MKVVIFFKVDSDVLGKKALWGFITKEMKALFLMSFSALYIKGAD